MQTLSRFASISVLIALPIFQQAIADEPKIGFVNMERVIRESSAAIMASDRMEQKSEARGLELQQMADDISRRQAALSQTGSTLSDSQRRVKETELAEITVRFQRMRQAFHEDISAWQDEATSDILHKATKAVSEIAESERLDIVFQEAVAVSNRLDITDKVIKKLTAE